MSQKSLREFEAVTGISFRDRNLLNEAFVHSSYANEAPTDEEAPADNERLEFLGDAVIEFVVSKYLFERFLDLREGELTRLRAALVRRETLSRVASARHLGEFLVLGKGEEDSGGRERAATLCATYEAVVGAIYLDQGLDAVEAFVMPDMLDELEIVRRGALGKDSKSRLQEWTQSEYGAAPRYRVVDVSGPDHAKTFVIEVTVLGHRCGIGQGSSKQDASQEAAATALATLGVIAKPQTRKTEDLNCRWPVAEGIRRILREASVAAPS